MRENRFKPNKRDMLGLTATTLFITTLGWTSGYMKKGYGLFSAVSRTFTDTVFLWLLLGLLAFILLLPWAIYHILRWRDGGVGRMPTWRRDLMSRLGFDMVMALLMVGLPVCSLFRYDNMAKVVPGIVTGLVFVTYLVVKYAVAGRVWWEERAKGFDTGNFSALNDERNKAVAARADQSVVNAFLLVLFVAGCVYEMLIESVLPYRTLVEVYVILALREFYLAYWNKRL